MYIFNIDSRPDLRLVVIFGFGRLLAATVQVQFRDVNPARGLNSWTFRKQT